MGETLGYVNPTGKCPCARCCLAAPVAKGSLVEAGQAFRRRSQGQLGNDDDLLFSDSSVGIARIRQTDWLRRTASEARVSEIRTPRVAVTKPSGYRSGPGPPRVKRTTKPEREASCPK